MIDLYILDKALHKKKFSIPTVKEARQKKQPLWLDLTTPTPDEVNLLKDLFGIHPITIEDFIHLNSRIKIEEFLTYHFIIIYAIGPKKHFQELDLLIGKHYIISSHTKPIESITHLKDRPAIIEHNLKRGPDFLLHRLIDDLIDNYTPYLIDMEDHIEKLDDTMSKEPNPTVLDKAFALKRLISHSKRITRENSLVITALASKPCYYISDAARTYFRDINDHAQRIVDRLDNSRDSLSTINEEYLTASSYSTNQVMKFLSIIATLMLPLTVLTSMYGMNVHLPFGQHPHAFWIVTGIMTALVTTMLLLFWKKNWL